MFVLRSCPPEESTGWITESSISRLPARPARCESYDFNDSVRERFGDCLDGPGGPGWNGRGTVLPE